MSNSKVHTGEWEINIHTQEDARRFARIGGYTGFTYLFLSTILAIFGAMGSVGPLMQMDAVELTKVDKYASTLGFLALRFIVLWVLALRTYSGKGFIAAPVLLTLVVIEMLYGVYSGVAGGSVIALMSIIWAVFWGFLLLAGVKGNWANREFHQGLRS